MTKQSFYFSAMLFFFITANSPAYSDDAVTSQMPTIMTNERLDKIIRRLDEQTKGMNGYWKFNISNLDITIITDEEADRMRIIIPIVETETLDSNQIYRVMQANFDSTLDARYAIANNILWSVYIHPLASLSDEEFLAGLGQTVNLVTNYGGSYSSGLLTFGGGDSNSLQNKQLIKELIEKGNAI